MPVSIIQQPSLQLQSQQQPATGSQTRMPHSTTKTHKQAYPMNINPAPSSRQIFFSTEQQMPYINQEYQIRSPRQHDHNNNKKHRQSIRSSQGRDSLSRIQTKIKSKLLSNLQLSPRTPQFASTFTHTKSNSPLHEHDKFSHTYQGKIPQPESVPAMNNKQFVMTVPRQQYIRNSVHASSKLRKIEPEEKINIYTTVAKPKFGFKKPATMQQTKNTQSEEQMRSQHQSQGVIADNLNKSKSASDFGQVLKPQNNLIGMSVRPLQNSIIPGYALSSIDKKQQAIADKLRQVMQANQCYDAKLKQKQRQIALYRNRVQKQHKQLHAYQSSLTEAYERIQTTPDSLSLASLNYQSTNQVIQARMKGNKVIDCQFMSLSKKIFKQIIYGKCVIFQNQVFQVGYDNPGDGLVQLYFTIKQQIMEMRAKVENLQQAGFYFPQGQWSMRVGPIVKGKRVRSKFTLGHKGDWSKQIQLMLLTISTQVNSTITSVQSIRLPFTLYHNFMRQPPITQLQPHPHRHNYQYLTPWHPCCDQLLNSPLNFLQSLFKSCYQIQQNVYHLQLVYGQNVRKCVNVVINCRNFAVQMGELWGMALVAVIGSLICKRK